MDKNKLKEDLTIDQVYELVSSLGANPRPISNKDYFVCQTICHNKLNQGSYKLYYYNNTHLFRCFTECNDTFDIFELVGKVKGFTLPQSINYVAKFFHINYYTSENFEDRNNSKAWKVLETYSHLQNLKNHNKINFNSFDKNILNFFPQPHIVSWEKEGIDYKSLKDFNIHYNPSSGGILIPHYDIDNNLIGIRERTIIKELEKYGKYRPAVINGKMYNHPLGFHLYGLNINKQAIQIIQKAILFEGEKSVLMYNTYFGKENNIAVSVCGNHLSFYQIELLLSLNVKEIIIAFDKESSPEDKSKWIKKFYEINDKYKKYIQISFIYDKKEEYLENKDSPLDKGKEIFLNLLKDRIYI